jgi:molybdate transport system ATP-binding protein
LTAILLKNISVKTKDKLLLSKLSLTINSDENWVIMGPNGCGKSVLAKLLSRQFSVSSGSITLPDKIQSITFESVTDILNHERYLDNSNTSGGYDKGTTTAQFIFGTQIIPSQQQLDIQKKFDLSELLYQGIKFLSTGEMRKALICKAMIKAPDLLILDEPFDGLDQKSCQILRILISKIRDGGTQIILCLNRISEIPSETTHFALMCNGAITKHGLVDSLLSSNTQPPPQIKLPTKQQANSSIPNEDKSELLIEMNQVNVSYSNKRILTDINWTVSTGDQWMISGPNGSGKTTLLNLITGDNTQGYSNNVRLFGRQKGSGESIWEIKRKIGYISTALQRNYRVGGTVLSAILSGFLDSIGIYKQTTKNQQDIAKDWLTLLRMERYEKKFFQNLSFGQQRLILLARAMIKQPSLLILDEPFQGLDDKNRELLLQIAQKIGSSGQSQLLYVTHRLEDEIPCINHHLQLIPCSCGGYTSVSSAL